VTLNEEKEEASSLCKAMYEQSIIYYNNFKAIESEYLKMCEQSLEKITTSQQHVKKVIDLMNQKGGKNAKQNQDQLKEHISDIRDRLSELQETIKQSRCNIDERKGNAVDEAE
jgi:peptidoglycan hydrolase CwlO-like protein